MEGHAGNRGAVSSNQSPTMTVFVEVSNGTVGKNPALSGCIRSTNSAKNREFKLHQVQQDSWISEPSTVLWPRAFPSISSILVDDNQAAESF